MIKKTIITGILTVNLLFAAATVKAQTQLIDTTKSIGQSEGIRTLDLAECIDIALRNNRFHSAAKYGLVIAEAQRKQALSAYWPRLNTDVLYSLMDEDLDFIFPSSEIKTPPMTMTIPEGFLFPGFPAEPIDMPIPEQNFQIPEQDITLMDRRNLLMGLNLTYPLFTGGYIRSVNKQAAQGVDIANQKVRRTDLKIIYDVKRFYYATVLTQNLLSIGEEAVARLRATLELTESLYKHGSGRVKKTDYLKNKIVVDNVCSLVASLKHNEQLARAALVNTLGLDWGTAIKVSDQEIPFAPYSRNLSEFVSEAYQFNPDWGKLQAAMKLFDAKVGEAKSKYFPKIALIGRLQHIENAYNFGMTTPRNKDMWTVGIGLELPIFSGGLARHQVKEARARLEKLEEQNILLREGLALQIQHIFLQMASAVEKQKSIKEGLMSAQENRSLTERAYQHELVDEKEMIESQIFESIMKAQYQKVLYDHIETQAHLDFVIGKEIGKQIQGK